MKNDNIVRNKRQCKSGGIMWWVMCIPWPKITYIGIGTFIGTFNSDKYIQLNYGNDYYYQEDNSRFHKSRKVKIFMQNSGIKVMKWPSRSPYLNIIEDIWKMISIQIYNGFQFNCKQNLTEKVIATINDINMQSRGAIVNLYRTRLVAVLKTNGDIFNKWLFILLYINCEKLW